MLPNGRSFRPLGLVCALASLGFVDLLGDSTNQVPVDINRDGVAELVQAFVFVTEERPNPVIPGGPNVRIDVFKYVTVSVMKGTVLLGPVNEGEEVGPSTPVTDQFVYGVNGLRFAAADGLHHGWIVMRQNFMGWPEFGSWGYEPVPGRPAIAGQLRLGIAIPGNRSAVVLNWYGEAEVRIEAQTTLDQPWLTLQSGFRGNSIELPMVGSFQLFRVTPMTSVL